MTATERRALVLLLRIQVADLRHAQSSSGTVLGTIAEIDRLVEAITREADAAAERAVVEWGR